MSGGRGVPRTPHVPDLHGPLAHRSAPRTCPVSTTRPAAVLLKSSFHQWSVNSLAGSCPTCQREKDELRGPVPGVPFSSHTDLPQPAQSYPMSVLLQCHLEGLSDAILLPAQAFACRTVSDLVYCAACPKPSQHQHMPLLVTTHTEHWGTPSSPPPSGASPCSVPGFVCARAVSPS